MLLSSCSDDEKTTGPSDLTIGQFNAKVDGVDWKVTNAKYYSEEHEIIASNSGAMGSNETQIVILLKGIPKGETPVVKTYNSNNVFSEFKEVDENLVYTYWNNLNTTAVITSATDTEIKGTFSCTVTSEKDETSKEISGSFYVPIR